MFLVTIFSIATSLAFAGEENINTLFPDVKYVGNSITISFPDEGIRYSVKLNEKDLGINQYKQALILKRGDILTLIHKHGSYTVTPVFEKIVGLNIKSHFYWGKENTVKSYFVEATLSTREHR